MNITLLLRYQIVYLLLGLGYNVMSLMMKRRSGRPLSFTNPVTGILVMLLFGLFLIPGFLSSYQAYRILMGISAIALGYSGVIVHLRNYRKLNLYDSTTAWILAVLINLFGVVLNLMAAIGKIGGA